MKKLYAQYGELISTARLELIYIGSADLDRVRQALASAFATLPRDGIRDIAVAAPHPARSEVRTVTEEMDVTQGKLGMGFACGSTDHSALLLGNTLFGGSSNSKLFLNVREKMSLCYYASSAYHRQKGLITVSSGIEFADYQRTYDEILRQLEAVQEKSELEDWELDGARSTLLNAYASMGDSQGKLENFYLGQAATGQSEVPGGPGGPTAGRDRGAGVPGHGDREAGHCVFPERQGGRGMKQTFYERIGESVYRETLPNGLQICVVPKAGARPEVRLLRHPVRRHGHEAFRLDGVVAGHARRSIAHFLEHKMFDTEDGNALQRSGRRMGRPPTPLPAAP